MAEKRRQFTREFKLEAVRLVSSGERKVEELARDLGVRADILRGWKKQAEGRAGRQREADKSKDEEIRALRRELEEVKQERDFLKKAATYFAKGSR
jgi:transposase